ncbi:outer-membrane lipoprotein carrier protein LolA [Methylobacterium persicinum]|uniref:Outer membrane lipoprotein-sorting protein n=1 Tax=Methylobacterium persicinum TaxID=374426 RepID=A0ABU0HGB8_9HYPH|nr:outer-membrane lipoprotein carrier protein LolA [Methylobacterium persicinum]MDQ0441367.1 outer membrane lipoprotein-sorting protein [Methylobacterium persicinum]GJE36412.1 Outer-membrane lipoprotein carrier protein [Methylobacterium persicinum]
MIGRRTRTVGTLLAASLTLAPLQAEAQVSSFLDGLFGRKEQAAPEPEATPAAPEAEPVKKPASKAPKPNDRTGSLKPAAKPTEKATEKAPRPAEPKVAAVTTPAPPAAAEPADPATVLAQANAYFNGISTLTGSFMQIGPDGRRIGGRLTLAKPGRLRFDYDAPSPLEVVADGTSVAVRDKKLATQDLYFIAQTPLKFLLREKIDLARDLSVTDVSNDPAGVRISLEDRATFGGTSRIQLLFDGDVKTLSQWRITDPQGYVTTVQLSNLQKGKPVDSSLFFINYGRAEDKAAQQAIQQSQRP